ncbi:MAG: hypothetical protein ACOX6H_01835 [Christensenellales bacterium]|jgi:hypothetical protein
MKKNIFKVLLTLVCFSFILTGCDEFFSKYYKAFKSVGSDLTPWGYYSQIEQAKQTINADFQAIKNKNLNGHIEFNNNLDSFGFLEGMLRDSVSALELFYTNAQTDVYFQYDDLTNYTVKKVAGQLNTFDVSYGKSVVENNLINGDVVVDNLAKRIIIPIKTRAKITSISSGAGSTEGTFNVAFNSVDVTMPDLSNLLDYVPASHSTPQGLAVYSAIIHSQTATKVDVTLEKKIDSANYYYRKRIVIELKNTLYTMTITSSLSDGSSVVKSYILNNKPSSMIFNLDQTNGYFKWDIYLSASQFSYSGEAYYQGRKQMLVQEKFNPEIAGHNLTKPYTNQLFIDGGAYRYKQIQTAEQIESITKQNIYEFAYYINEISAITLERASASAREVAFRKYGN